MRTPLILTLMAITACTATTQTTPTTSTAPASTTPSTTTPAVPVTSSAPDPTSSPCATEDRPFTAEGSVGAGGAARSDATTIEAFRWEVFADCERVRISFTTPEGAPAVSTPVVGAQLIRHLGILRIEYAASVSDASVVEQNFDTDLLARMYVFTTAAGTLVSDIHLGAPVFARAVTETSPAAIVIDLIPGGDDYAAPAVVADGVVLFGPDPAVVGYPITVTGYVAPGGAERLSGRLEAADGSVVTAGSSVSATGWAWGGFAMVFPDGPPGAVTVSIEGGPALKLTVP